MRSLVHGLRERAAVCPRTLIAARHNVWVWPGIALTMRRGAEVVALSGETIRFWITRWHGPEALYTEAVYLVAEAARCLTRGDETAAQRALDAIGLDRLSPDGAALMRCVAGRLGLKIPGYDAYPGPRSWTAREIDLQLPFVTRNFDCNAPLAKFGPFDPLKHPRWEAGAPESQGGRFRPKDDSDAVVVPAASRGPGGGKPKGPSPVPGVRFAEPVRPSRAKIPLPLPPPRPSDLGHPLDPETLKAQAEEAERQRLIGHNGGPPLEDPPKIPLGNLSEKVRNFFAKAAVRWIVRGFVLAAFPEVAAYIVAIQAAVWIAQAAWPYIKAYFDPPKTFEELQRDALTPQEGYDIHHSVEKDQAEKDGVPESVWDGPENRLRIPTLKHWLITSWYMTKNERYGGLSPRQYLKGKSWEEKMRVGREALTKFGVLKP